MPAKVKATQAAAGEAPLKAAKMMSTDLERVAAAIRVGASSAVAQMLLAGLPHAFISDCDDVGSREEHCGRPQRHEFQEDVIVLIDKVVRRALASAEEARENIDQQRKLAYEDLDVLKAACDDVARQLEERRGAVTSRSTETRQAHAAVLEAELAHEEAQSALQPAEEALRKAEAMKSVVEGATEELQMLVNDCAEEELAPAERGKRVGSVREFLADINAEPALLAAVNGALGRPGSERGRFSQMTVDSISQVIRAKAREAEEKVAAATPAVEEASALRLGEWAILDLTRETEDEASKALTDAREAERLAGEEECASKNRVKSQERCIDAITEEALRAEVKLDSLKQSVEALERLASANGGNDVLPDSSDRVSPMSETPLSTMKQGSPTLEEDRGPITRVMDGKQERCVASDEIPRCIATPTRCA